LLDAPLDDGVGSDFERILNANRLAGVRPDFTVPAVDFGLVWEICG
jgi:hypothetical protein